MGHGAPGEPGADARTCHDCDKELQRPFNYCLPATPEQSNLMRQGLYVERPSLCHECWLKRIHPDS